VGPKELVAGPKELVAGPKELVVGPKELAVGPETATPRPRLGVSTRDFQGNRVRRTDGGPSIRPPGSLLSDGSRRPTQLLHP
jgi:hypothetical protein